MNKFYSKAFKSVCSKQLAAATVFTSLFGLSASAQCPSGDLVLRTQSDVAQFAIDYPNCTQIVGKLQLGADIYTPPGDIIDVSPLGNITYVSGNVFIQNNALLKDVDGLNLTAIGGWLYVGGDTDSFTNLELRNLNGLSSLINVGRDIYINYNRKLSDISGLQNASFGVWQGYGLTINENPMLPICNIPNFCDYLSYPAATHPRIIAGNAAYCADEPAAVAACLNPPTSTGCTDENPGLSQWPSTTFTPSCTGTEEVITNNAWTGEYSKVALTAGVTYTFTSSIAYDYLTIADESGANIFTHGNGPVNYTPAADETVRFYLHSNLICTWGDSINRSRIIMCDAPSNLNEVAFDNFKYYPNPVTDFLTINHDRKIGQIVVVNMLGQAVISKSINANTAKIDMSALVTGSYFVKVAVDGQVKTMKVLKH
jgi:hypothetical protein